MPPRRSPDRCSACGARRSCSSVTCVRCGASTTIAAGRRRAWPRCSRARWPTTWPRSRPRASTSTTIRWSEGGMTRRPFQPLARLTLALALLTVAGAARAADPGLLVTVGEVTDTTAVLWVRGQPGQVEVQLGPAGGGDPRQGDIKLSAAAHVTGKLPLLGLTPGTRYVYTMAQNGVSVRG